MIQEKHDDDGEPEEKERCRPMRKKPGKPFLLATLRILLGATAAVMLFLAVSTLIRSVRTAQVNDTLSALHAQAAAETASAAAAEVESRSVPVQNASAAQVSRMGFPDGGTIPESAGKGGASGAAGAVRPKV